RSVCPGQRAAHNSLCDGQVGTRQCGFEKMDRITRQFSQERVKTPAQEPAFFSSFLLWTVRMRVCGAFPFEAKAVHRLSDGRLRPRRPADAGCLLLPKKH